MAARPTIDVIIPALNEEAAIGKVIAEIPKDWVRYIWVADNGSTDDTCGVATRAGARVVKESEKGYGAACLRAIHHATQMEEAPEIFVFLDGDHSDFPAQLPEVVAPILAGEAEVVIGSRVLGHRDRGSLTAQQRFGNALATWLIRLLYGAHFTDLGPFRAVTFEAYERMAMSDRNYGWTVEMQVKAARLRIPHAEVPVNYRVRIGESKVSGTLKGAVMAGYKILRTIFVYHWQTRRMGQVA